jgi:hypothetical protein
MAITTLNFTFAQSADCDTLTFTETTGDGTGGYSDGGNPAFSDVKNTLLKIEFPDGTTGNIHKSYLPTQDASPNGTKDYVASDFGYTKIPNGVWEVTFNIYTTDTASGALVNGTEYIVTGSGGQITYDGTVYTENETFVAGATATYTEDVACEVNELHATKTCNVLFYCGVKKCLKDLMLLRCGNECDCRDDFHEAMNELIIDMNAAILAFDALNYACANKTIKRLEKHCGGICNDCGC